MFKPRQQTLVAPKDYPKDLLGQVITPGATVAFNSQGTFKMQLATVLSIEYFTKWGTTAKEILLVVQHSITQYWRDKPINHVKRWSPERVVVVDKLIHE